MPGDKASGEIVHAEKDLLHRVWMNFQKVRYLLLLGTISTIWHVTGSHGLVLTFLVTRVDRE